MESNIKAHMPAKKHISVESSAEINSYRLGAFFDLLLQIDKRNHPEKYDYQKHRDSADQTTSGTDWNSPPRI